MWFYKSIQNYDNNYESVAAALLFTGNVINLTASLTILRLAVYEIRYDEDVPTGVAINEAVELAKKFGQDASYGFVNGVLAKFV